MARESQGLQVLLIVFVMLCVVLGVTLYLKIKTADEATKAAVAANQAKQQAEQATNEMQKERDDLKMLIGMPERSTEEIKKQTADYMQTYGNAKQSDADPAKGDKPLFDAGALHYARLLESMYKTLQDRTDELIRARALAADLRTKFDNREAAHVSAITAITTKENELSTNFQKIAADYTAQLASNKAVSDEAVRTMTAVRTNATREVDVAKNEVKEAKKAVLQKEDDVAKIAKTLAGLNRQQMDVPSGEITWVSLPNKMVWINRGQADFLQRQTKFTVYSADSSAGAKAVKKGTVEVVRIEGAHSSQAKILEDKLADPIMTGDKVFTPLWSPGQQNHFALTGIMNLDGDGRNQLSVVRGLINQNGGVVDCELDEQGHKQGQITAETRFIVVGDTPDKSSGEFIKNNGEILRDGDRYHLQVLKLSDFKQQMGYQKSSSVEHFGSGTTSSSDVSRAASAMKASKPAPKAADATAP